MKDDILGPNHEALFLASVMGAKMMLRSRGWSGESDPQKLGLLEKRISVWSQEVIIRELDVIVKKHKMPEFASEVVKNSDFTSPALLHMRLLINASKHLIELCHTGLGTQTMKKMEDWFGMMKTTRNSRLCDLCPQSVKNDINHVIRDFRHFEFASDSDANTGRPEYPYFDPHSLYIQVAYMVYFYTNSNEKARPPCTTVGAKTHMRKKLMYDWEYLSGELFDGIFGIYSHGLHIADEPVTTDHHFSSIKLPYTELRNLVMGDDDNPNPDGVPSVLELHNTVMRTMSCKLVDISTLQPSSRGRWRNQIYQWTMLCAKATSNGVKISKSKTQNRESVLRNYVKSRTSTKPYTPRCPDYFERDIHIMGPLSSLYYTNFDPVGKVAKQFIIF